MQTGRVRSAAGVETLGGQVLHEAELFVMAEHMLVEVLGRIRPEEREVLLPPMFPGADRPATMQSAVEQYLRADAHVPRVLSGGEAPAQEHPGEDVVARTVRSPTRPPGARLGRLDIAAETKLSWLSCRT